MKNVHKITLSAAIIAATALPFATFAATSVTTGVTGAVNSAVAVPTSVNANANTDVNVQATDAMSSSSMMSATDMSSSSSTNTSATTDMNAGVMLNLNQGDMQATNASMVSANTVTSDDSLNAYAQGQLASDANIKNVSANDNSVSVQYVEPVKFLGFIPARETATATVNADGSVNVHYPWYGFLSAKNADAIKTDIQARTTSLVEANGSANASFSAQTKASLLDNVISVLKNYGGSASASATTNTTASANTSASGY